MSERQKSIRVLPAVLVMVLGTIVAGPAAAGFFLEGTKPYKEESRCTDPYARNLEGCKVKTVPAPENPHADADDWRKQKSDNPGPRLETRRDLAPK